MVLGRLPVPLRIFLFQVVGITNEELRAAQHWTGNGVLSIMKRKIVSGGPFLVTDMKRHKCIYDLDDNVAEEIETGIETQGSDLSGVSAKIAWTCEPKPPQVVDNSPVVDGISLPVDRLQISTEDSTSLDNKGTAPASVSVAGVQVTVLESLHITINLESGALLPLALRGRLKHGRHFTFRVSQFPTNQIIR